jgi:hypothetical protein
MQHGAHAIKWYDWTEWSTTDKCPDSCGEEQIKQTRTRSCNPTNICELPDESRYSGGLSMAGKRWYCEGQQGCKGGRHATETRHVSFVTACPCETCTRKGLYMHTELWSSF